jgi:hypothetical protein
VSPRKQRVSPNARRTTVYLTTAQEHALATIEHERRHRKEGRDSPSEIVADAIWLIGQRYDVRRKEIETRFPEPSPEPAKNKVTVLKPRKKQ